MKNSQNILYSDDKSKDIASFWREIQKKIDETNQIYSKYIDLVKEVKEDFNSDFCEYRFSNIKFPKSIFNDPSNNSFYGLNNNISIYFQDCVFLDEIDFSLISNAKEVSFINCRFDSNIVFMNQKFKNLFLFENCIVNADIKFQNIIFEGVTTFISSSFNKIEFIHSRSEEIFLFNSVEMDKLLFDNTFFNKNANFLDIKDRNSKDSISSRNIANRETARIIKHSFEQLNNTIEANKYYALEMEKREEELSFFKNSFEWIVFKLHQISSNHSQDWFLVLLWILNVTGIYLLIQKNTYYYVDEFLGFSILLAISAFVYSILEFNKCSIGKMALSISFIIFLVCSQVNLNEVVNLIDPFTASTFSKESLTIGLFTYKIVVAYLIYQFIISIRQNTRRK